MKTPLLFDCTSAEKILNPAQNFKLRMTPLGCSDMTSISSTSVKDPLFHHPSESLSAQGAENPGVKGLIGSSLPKGNAARVGKGKKRARGRGTKHAQSCFLTLDSFIFVSFWRVRTCEYTHGYKYCPHPTPTWPLPS